jgi:hypothetical protein
MAIQERCCRASQEVRREMRSGEGEDALELAPTVPYVYYKPLPRREATTISLGGVQIFHRGCGQGSPFSVSREDTFCD